MATVWRWYPIFCGLVPLQNYEPKQLTKYIVTPCKMSLVLRDDSFTITVQERLVDILFTLKNLYFLIGHKEFACFQ